MSKLSIIDLASVTSDLKPLVNHAFRIWLKEYTEIFSACGETVIPELFWRSKIMTVIHDESGVQGFSLHNFYDLSLEGVASLGYFEPVNDFLITRMIRYGEKAFSVEFVTVRDDLKKNGLAARVMGCAFNAFAISSCTIATGFSRTDVKADQLAMKFGFKKLDLIQLHGIECGVMVLHKADLVEHPKPEVQADVRALWENKDNHALTLKNQKAA